MKELKGYRRTAFKSKHENLLNEKLEDFRARGEEVKAVKQGSYWLIYIKLEKELNVEKTKKVVRNKKQDAVSSVVAGGIGTKAQQGT